MTFIPAEQIVSLVRVAAAEGLTATAERVRAVAVPLTPLEYGDLRSSLTVVPADPVDLESAVVSDLPYAVKQHEDLTLRHDDGQAKFLETAAVGGRQDVAALMLTAARRRIGG